MYVTIDIAAESNKINGNELRDILYNEARDYHKFGDNTISTKEFSITNLEGKLAIRRCLHNHHWEMRYHSFASCIIFNSSFICFILFPALICLKNFFRLILLYLKLN